MSKPTKPKEYVCGDCGVVFESYSCYRSICDDCNDSYKKTMTGFQFKEKDLSFYIKSKIKPCKECGQKFVMNAKSTEICESCLFPARRCF